MDVTIARRINEAEAAVEKMLLRFTSGKRSDEKVRAYVEASVGRATRPGGLSSGWWIQKY